MRHWLKHHPGVLIFGLLVITTGGFFGWQIGSLENVVYRPNSSVSDLMITFWPNIAYIQHSVEAFGQIPLWRTLIFGGSPFDVDPQSGLWYPPNLIFLLAPATVGFNILFILHALLGGMGMWFWARSTGSAVPGATLASLAYALAPKSYAHLGFGHAGLFYAAAYVPWILWASYMIGRGRWTFAGVFGLALGWQIIAHPQLAFYTGLMSGVYFTGVAVSNSGAGSWIRGIRQPVAGAVFGAGIALAVAAPQLVPLMRFAPLSSRAGLDFAGSAVSSLPWRYLVGLVIADHGGFMDYVLYAGAPILALSLLALPRRQGRFWGFFIIFALVYALGTNTPVYTWTFKIVPALTWLRAPSRIWFIASAALALMAGWGLDHWLRGLSARARRASNLAWAAAGALALSIVVGYWSLFGVPPAELAAAGLIIAFAAAIFLLSGNALISQRIFLGLLLSIAVIDLSVVDGSFIEGRAAEAVFANDDLARYLSVRHPEGLYRVYSPSYSLPRHIAAEYNIETTDGVDPLYLEAYDRYMEIASGVKRQGYGVTVPEMAGEGPIALINQGARPDLDLLGLLNVKYVASEYAMSVDGLRELARFGSTYLYENERCLPRTFVVGAVDSVGNFEEALNFVQSHDVSRTAAIEKGSPLANGKPNAKIAWKIRTPNKLILDVSVDRKSLLVLSQNWYPNWKVEVDGNKESLYRVNAVLSGVYLDAGNHTVNFVYRPNYLIEFIILSILGISASFLLIEKGIQNK